MIYKPYPLSPLRCVPPLVVTQAAMDMLGDSDSLDLIPGETVKLCLANLNDNYEDCIVVCRERALEGMLAYSEIVVVNIRDTDTDIPIGEKITMEKYDWWCLSTEAVVVGSTLSQSGDRQLTLLHTATITDGDKVATHHGQKGVIKLTSRDDMPYGVDRNAGRIDFDMIISVSSAVSQVTLGQIYEMKAGYVALSLGWTITDTEYIRDYGNSHVLNECVVNLVHKDSIITRKCDNKVVPVSADWGYARV
jgi:hypothetical protein